MKRSIGDHRLNERGIHILDKLGLSPGSTIPEAFKTWKEMKAAYRFFDNPSVSEDKILAAHLGKTIERVAQYPVVLFVSDTTDINYTTKTKMKGKERLDNKQNGLWLHSTIAVTPDKLNLGLIQSNFWHREDEVAEKSKEYKTARDKAPIEKKESFRWIDSYEYACEISKEVPRTQIINICDREGDIIEFFEKAQDKSKEDKKANFIVRSQYNRLIQESMSEEGEITNKLWKKLSDSEALGELEYTITSRWDRKSRRVKQTIKSATIVLTPANKNKSIVVNAVMAIEENPPEGEDPIIWVLLTDLEVNSFEKGHGSILGNSIG